MDNVETFKEMSCQNCYQHNPFSMNHKVIWLGSLNIRVEGSKKKKKEKNHINDLQSINLSFYYLL